MNSMASEILSFVQSRGGALFHEIILHLGPRAQGTGHLHLAAHPNVVLWADVSEEFVEAFNEVFDELEMRRATPYMYAAFSDELGWPRLPVVSAEDYASGKLDYDEKRWLPVVFFMKQEMNGSGTTEEEPGSSPGVSGEGSAH